MAFQAKQADGLYQKALRGVWYVRRAVPEDLRTRLGRAMFRASTKTRDHARAVHIRDQLWGEWSAEIAEARRLGSSPVAELSGVLAAIDNWRTERCADAAGYRRSEQKLATLWAKKMQEVVDEGVRGYMPPPGEVTPSPSPPSASSSLSPVKSDAEFWAWDYFNADPTRPRGSALPYHVGVLIGRLQVAARDPEGWVALPGFDAAMDRAMAAGGLTSAVPLKIRSSAREKFARAWLEVTQHEEAERVRADAVLSALEKAAILPVSIQVPRAAAPVFEPREDDRTVDEVIDAFKTTQDDTVLYVKQYGHIAKALVEILGAERPMRSLTRDDVRDVYRFLCTVPTNAGKVYKGLTLAEAAQRAERDGRPLLAPNSVRSYMVALKGLCSFALERGWIDQNPVDGQVPGKRDVTRRRGFTKLEMEKAFSALAVERKAGTAWWWVPAVLAFSGARANEICQLHVEDIKETDGVPYIDLSEFDLDGRRLERRRLKTGDSARCIPIHSQLVRAGFLDFVAGRRMVGDGPLFLELKQNALGYHSHEVSRRWGRHLDSIGLSEPSLTLHSLRHSWKDSADDARLPDYILAALGGWGGGNSAMFRYGDRCSARRVPMNAEHIEQITLGGFTFDEC